MPAAQVFVSLPVAQYVERWTGGDGRQTGLWDLQLLEVGVDRRVGPALTCRRCCLEEEERTSDAVFWCTFNLFKILFTTQTFYLFLLLFFSWCLLEFKILWESSTLFQKFHNHKESWKPSRDCWDLNISRSVGPVQHSNQQLSHPSLDHEM